MTFCPLLPGQEATTEAVAEALEVDQVVVGDVLELDPTVAGNVLAVAEVLLSKMPAITPLLPAVNDTGAFLK